MENVQICELCNKSEYAPFYSTIAYDTAYNLVKCNCGLVFMNPRPSVSDIEKYYQRDYFNQHLESSKPTIDYLEQNKRLDKQRLDFILKKHRLDHKSLLDVGCGCGTFLDLISTNANTLGIEPNIIFSEYARTEYKLNVITSSFIDYKFNEKYDYICLWHVLNMVPNPSDLLKKLKKSLKPGGIIFIEIPNYLNAPKMPWKKRRLPADPGQFFYFNKSTIEKFLKKNGLNIQEFKYIKYRSWMILSAQCQI